MSIIYCEKHDRRWDSDRLSDCPLCECEPPTTQQVSKDGSGWVIERGTNQELAELRRDAERYRTLVSCGATADQLVKAGWSKDGYWKKELFEAAIDKETSLHAAENRYARIKADADATPTFLSKPLDYDRFKL